MARRKTKKSYKGRLDRRRPSPKKKRRSAAATVWSDVRVWLLWTVAGILVTAAVALAWLYGQGPGETAAQASTTPKATASTDIVFEEQPPALKQADKREKINDAMLEALLAGGVAPTQAKLAVVAEPWGEVSQIKAYLHSGQRWRDVQQAIIASMKPLNTKVTWRKIATGNILEIEQNGRVTHRLILINPIEAQKPPRPKGKPRVAIVIDDMGYQLNMAKQLIAIDLPLSFSVLPFSPYGHKVAELALAKGKDVLLHLPMEPKSYPGITPGPGGLYRSMPPSELSEQASKNLDFLPQAVGVNNHMGSRFTEDRQAMLPVLRVVKDRGLFFVDSYTSPNSKAYELAGEMQMKRGRRGVFLDHDQDQEAVEHQLEALIHLAQNGHGVIAIGHPHTTTLNALRRYTKRLKEEVRLVPVSQIVSKPGN